MGIKVIKRDGRKENYSEDKILRVVKAAGLSNNEANILAKSITEWLNTQGKNEVTSVQIRDKIIIKIQKINMPTAKKFIWYEKQRDKNFGLS